MLRRGVIPDCGDTDSSAAPSTLEHGAYIPLDHRIFLQWNVPVGRTQHESGSASFGIKHSCLTLSYAADARSSALTWTRAIAATALPIHVEYSSRVRSAACSELSNASSAGAPLLKRS